MYRIAISNITGGRNRGCEALVSSIAYGLSREMGAGNLRLSLHTQDPIYDGQQFSDVMQAVYSTSNLPPAKLSPRVQRLYYRAAKWARRAPTRRFVPGSVGDSLDADLIIATGGDTFTSDYRNFSRHARTLNVGTPVALLAQTIGPFTKADAERFVASTRNVALCTVRESETLEYIQQMAPELQPRLTADVAFLLPQTGADAARSIVEVDNRFPIGERRLTALSVSAGLMSYRSDVDAEHYLEEIVAFIDDLNRSDWSVLLIPHVQENWRKNNDVYVCRDVLRRVKSTAANAILYSPMSASDFKGVIGLCQALVGVRMHTNIASMSQGIPTVAIAYSRKAWAIMRDYYGAAVAEKITLDAAKLDCERLREAFDHAIFNGRTESKAAQMSQLAGQNFVQVRELLDKSR